MRLWNTPAEPLQVSVIWYYTASDGEILILKLWGMWSTHSLPLFSGSLGLGVEGSAGVQSIGQIELFNLLTVSKQMTDTKLNCQGYIAILKSFNYVQTNNEYKIKLFV